MKPGMQIMRRRQERTIRLSNISTGWQEQKRYFGIYNIREIEERRREIMPAPNGYVLIDVTQNINRQNWLGLYSAIMRVCILVLSFMLSGSVVRISLKDIITLSKSVKHSDISSLNEQHYFDNLPQDDEINTIAMAINTMKRRIQSQVSSLKEFLAFASHELKTPLMMIQSSAESAQFTKNYKASLANIKTGIEKMQHIIEQLNTFVKLDGNILLQRESANLTQLCKDIVKQLELIYGDKQISISIQSEQDLIINSYPHLINSILSNLLDNAFKYTNQN